MTIKDVPAVDRLLKREFAAHNSPVIELIEAQTHDPFCVLVGTILSARTKDACTAGAVRRLFSTAAGPVFTPVDLERLSVPQIEKLIFPVGFYHDKARHLHALPQALREFFPEGLENAGKGLSTVAHYNALVERLCSLPGVGRKTANLTVAVGFDLPADLVGFALRANPCGSSSGRPGVGNDLAFDLVSFAYPASGGGMSWRFMGGCFFSDTIGSAGAAAG